VRILIIDDDAELCALLKELLQREGYTVECETDGRRGLEAALKGDFRLAVLDVMLPGMDGFEILRRLRQQSKLPVLMLTARGEDTDRIIGLELGADDYLCKPFSMRELMARVKVLLRRAAYSARDEQAADETFSAGALRVDPVRLSVTWRGRAVPLTVTEFLLVQALARRPGAVLTRDQLMDSAYPDRTTVSDRTIDSHVKRIRRKFTAVDSSFAMIEGVYGAGYRFRA